MGKVARSQVEPWREVSELPASLLRPVFSIRYSASASRRSLKNAANSSTHVDLAQRLRLQPVEPVAPLAPRAHELGLLEHAQVLAHRAIDMPNGSASSLAGCSPPLSVTRIARRAGCAIA